MFIPTTNLLQGSGMTRLFDQTLGADTAAIDTGASGFSAALSHLLIYMFVRTDQATVFSSANLTLNNDTGANYDRQRLLGTDVTASAATGVGAANVPIQAPGSSVAATVFGAIVVFIPSYAQTVGMKTLLSVNGWGEPTAAENEVRLISATWRNTAAISRIAITGNAASNLVAGSRMTVYGLT